jgi:hypothetical protein
MFQMKYPEGYLWEYPGFPSITVSYLKTNDFFFSGHCGMPILMAMEFRKIKHYKMFIFCLFTCIFEAFTMIVMRGHYSIDILAGIIFAHYIFIQVNHYVNHLDSSCLSMDREKTICEEEVKILNTEKLNKEKEFIPVEVRRV